MGDRTECFFSIKHFQNEGDKVEAFEEWFLAIPDADETLLEKEDDRYINDEISAWFYMFSVGWDSGRIRIS